MIWPVAEYGGPPRQPDMPEKVAEFYDEASEVFRISPRAAAALLRLALEALLLDLYPNAGTLNGMIASAVQAGLPSEVQQAMDYVRFSGNNAVHELHEGDDEQSAEVLFGLVNLIVDRLVTQPQKTDALYKSLPESFQSQVAKRDNSHS